MPYLHGSGMKGLTAFITDIRKCKSKINEQSRINKELANIRCKFNGEKGYDGYQKKKYVCKLVYIFLLGYQPEVGSMEALSLLSSNLYSEKKIGYLFISVMISKNSKLCNLINQTVKNDLINPAKKSIVELALHYIANVASSEMVTVFKDLIISLIKNQETLDSTKQSCYLTLMAFVRNNPDIELSDLLTNDLFHTNDLGVVSAAVSLIETLTLKNPKLYIGFSEKVVDWLYKIVIIHKNDFKEYSYYLITAPWLTIKLLKYLQLHSYPEKFAIEEKLEIVLIQIISKNPEVVKSSKIQHLNIRNAVIIEAINLTIHYKKNQSLFIKSAHFLANLLKYREANYRYLALESLSLLASSINTHACVTTHQHMVLSSLKTEKDTSIKQKSIELLYCMADSLNAATILSHLFFFLPSIDYSLREELAIKIAILSEKFTAEDYVDNILRLISIAGDYVSEEVWFRVIQVVTNRPEVQGYAAKTVFEALQEKACHENMVRVGAYFLGEFGNLIAGDPRSSPMVQVKLIEYLYHMCNNTTQLLILTTLIKLCNLYPEVKPYVFEILNSDNLRKSTNVEIQQRSLEYAGLLKNASVDLMSIVFQQMPQYSNDENSSTLLSRLKNKNNSPNFQEKKFQITTNKSSSPKTTTTPIVSPQIDSYFAQFPLTTEVDNTIASNGLQSFFPDNSHILKINQQLPPSFIDCNNQICSSNLQEAQSVYTNEMINRNVPGRTLSEQLVPVTTAVNTGFVDTTNSIFSLSNNLITFNRNTFVDISSINTLSYNTTVETSPLNIITNSVNTAPTAGFPLNQAIAEAPSTSPTNSSLLQFQQSTSQFPFNKFLCKVNGILHEDSLIQIGFKFVPRLHLCSFYLYYGNKSKDSYTDFNCQTINLNKDDRLKILSSPLNNSLQAQEQTQQSINVECIQEFDQPIEIIISFNHLKTPHQVKTFLPIAVNRFFQESAMNHQQFFNKWSNLEQEVKVLHSATLTMESELVITRLASFNLPPILSIDPNPHNFTSVAVFHTTTPLYGVMVRIEANRSVQ